MNSDLLVTIQPPSSVYSCVLATHTWNSVCLYCVVHLYQVVLPWFLISSCMQISQRTAECADVNEQGVSESDVGIQSFCPNFALHPVVTHAMFVLERRSFALDYAIWFYMRLQPSNTVLYHECARSGQIAIRTKNSEKTVCTTWAYPNQILCRNV